MSFDKFFLVGPQVLGLEAFDLNSFIWEGPEKREW